MTEQTAFHSFARRLTGDDPDARDRAAGELLARYSAQLAAIARRQLAPRLRCKVAAEDVVQSVLRTFFRRLGEGQVELLGWGELWGLLAVTTLRKCRRDGERFSTARRDAAREVAIDDEIGGECLLIPARGPTPEEQAAFLDELGRLLDGLSDRDRAAVELMLAGETCATAADRLGCSQRTVRRTRDLVRRRLLARDVDGP